jgi:guanylate kinase
MGKVIIFSAPSGSGKTTLVKHLLKVRNDLAFSISATTRDPRPGEVDGEHYHFLKLETFKKAIADESLLEWEEVYKDTFYGTLKSEVQRIWDSGKHVIFDVDVVGGANLKEHFGDKAKAVFVKVQDMKILKERLEGRGTENAESLKKRLDKAAEELTYEGRFDVTIINNDLETAYDEVEQVASAFLDR